MKELRLELYTQIEALEVKLRNESLDVDQYGFAPSEIRDEIRELENRISETWAR